MIDWLSRLPIRRRIALAWWAANLALLAALLAFAMRG